MDIAIRPFDPADFDRVVALFLEAFTAPPWSESWSHQDARARLGPLVRHRDGMSWVVTRAGLVVGFALGRPVTGIRGAPTFLLEEMAIAESLRFRGLGTSLLEHVEGEARARGLEDVEILTHEDVWVCRYYEGRGYRIRLRVDDGTLVLGKPVPPERRARG